MWDEPTTKKDKTIVKVRLPDATQIVKSIYSKLISEGMTNNSDYEITTKDSK